MGSDLKARVMHGLEGFIEVFLRARGRNTIVARAGLVKADVAGLPPAIPALVMPRSEYPRKQRR